MAAAATDLFQEVGLPGSATNLTGSGYTVGNTSITVTSTANWPTATGLTFAIDRAEVVNNETVRIEDTYCEFVGTVAGGTSITNVSKVFGPDQDYPAGALTRVYIPVASERENRLVEGILVHANQDGTLKAAAATTSVIADSAATTRKIKPTVIDSNFTAQASRYTTSNTSFQDVTGCSLSYTSGATAEKLILTMEVMASGGPSYAAECTLNIDGTDQTKVTYHEDTFTRQSATYTYNVAAATAITIKVRARASGTGTISVVNEQNKWKPSITGIAISNV